MILSNKVRYAIMAIMDMAESGNDHPISLCAIAKKHNISLSYLEQIFSKLRRANVVESVKGPGGGYKIVDLSSITVADIIRASGESMKMTQCNTNNNCINSSSKCKTHYLWKGLENAIYTYLQSIPVNKICSKNN